MISKLRNTTGGKPANARRGAPPTRAQPPKPRPTKGCAGRRKRSAQQSAGRSDHTHAVRIEAASTRVDEAGRALREQPTISVDLPDTRVPAGRTVYSGERNQVRLNDQPRFAGDGVDLTIRGPERIALAGPTGAGKSTLLHVISGHIHAERAADITRADGRIAYRTQRLDILDPS